MKRLLDIVGALVGMLVALPLICIVAAAVFIADPGPELFRQERVGRGGNRFRILKFRTMVTDAERRLHSDPVLFERYVADGYRLSTTEDPRVTRVGRLLRATSLDELPQLLNVLGGSMSLVGPRPVLPNEIDQWGHRADRCFRSARA